LGVIVEASGDNAQYSAFVLALCRANQTVEPVDSGALDPVPQQPVGNAAVQLGLLRHAWENLGQKVGAQGYRSSLIKRARTEKPEHFPAMTSARAAFEGVAFDALAAVSELLGEIGDNAGL
jgi:hypothetical protein